MITPWDEGYYFEEVRPVDLGELCRCGNPARWEAVFSGDYLEVQRFYCDECKKLEFDHERLL